MTAQLPSHAATTDSRVGADTAGGTGWTRAAALTGALFVALVVPGVLLTMGSPSSNASATKVSHYYLTHQHQVGGAGLLVIASVVAGLGFFTYLRIYFRRITGLDWLPSLFLTGAIVFGVSGAIGAGVNLTLSDSPKSFSPDALQALNTLSQNLSWAALCAGLALMYIAMGVVIVRTRILPTWLAWGSWLMALLAVTFFLSFVPFIGVAVWVLVVSVRMAARNPSLGTAP